MIKILLLSITLLFCTGSFSVEPDYKIYVCTMSQLGIENPVVHVLNSSIGAITWTRLASGYYRGFLMDAFIPNKTWIVFSGDGFSACLYGNEHEIVVISRNWAGLPADGVLNNASLEVRIYEST